MVVNGPLTKSKLISVIFFHLVIRRSLQVMVLISLVSPMIIFIREFWQEHVLRLSMQNE